MTQEQFLQRILPLQPRLQLVAERLLGSPDEAEDAVQEVVLRLWQQRDKLQKAVSPEAYAMQALKHQCVSQLRHRRPTVDISTLPDLDNDEVRTEVQQTEERAAMLDAMLTHLPDVQRQAVQLRYIDRLSHSEMQQRLGMSSSNVYTTLSRAVSALKQMLKTSDLWKTKS